MGCGQKSFKLVWWCHQLLSGFLANDHLPQVSRLSANDKDDNDVILPHLLKAFLAAVHGSIDNRCNFFNHPENILNNIIIKSNRQVNTNL
jgi:hypothetical protein